MVPRAGHGEPSGEPLPELLRRRAAESPERVAFTFEGGAYSFAWLDEAIERAAAQLACCGVGPGERVVVALPNGPQFFAAFYGIQRAGAAAVPLYADSGPRRLLRLAERSRACGLVVDEAAAEAVRQAVEAASGPPRFVVTPEQLAAPVAPPATPWPAPDPDALAFLQYTSGSTGEPKGVELTHRCLAVNVGQLVAGMEITPADVFVSWLPVCHDMGLILMTMVPFALPAPLHLLPARLTEVGRWVATLERRRCTFTAAPDFAYRLLLRRGGSAEAADLSSLRVALNAAEPVRATTIARFHDAFALPRPAMTAGYGLAEATVGVSMSKPGERPVEDDRGLVSVGRPFTGIEVEIVDEAGRALSAGETGQIAVRTPAACRGYFGDPEATARLFLADGALLTGDLGYLDDAGRLYIAGRLKNLLITGGRNLAPQEVEELVDELPFVRRSAAVGVDRGGAAGEQVYVFAELAATAARHPEHFADHATEIVHRYHAELGGRPGRVYLLRPRAIPQTRNGKLQHAALRTAYLDGTLRQAGVILFPEY